MLLVCFFFFFFFNDTATTEIYTLSLHDALPILVLSSLRAPVTNKKNGANPLIRDQMELVPNITHVFTLDQHLYLQYEVYDAAKGKNPAPAAAASQKGTAQDAPAAKPPKHSIRVFTSIEFLQGATKIYESKPVVANEVTAPERKAVIFQMDF